MGRHGVSRAAGRDSSSTEQELMRAGLRLGFAVLAAGLTLGAAPLLAQSIPQSTTNTPSSDTIGPKELQNFSLDGTVERRAEPAPVPRSTTPLASKRSAGASRSSAASAPPPTAPVAERPTVATESPQPRSVTSEPPRQVAQALQRPAQTSPSSSVTVALPPLGESPVSSSLPPSAAPSSPVFPSEPDGLNAQRKLALWPWLLAALALGAGAAFLFWRRRSREVFAGGPRIDAFSAPEPAPPRPAPAPRVAPLPAGVVSTRLRPWLDLTFQPLRCIVEDTSVTVEFELDVYNSGSAPARAVLVEASLFNAGPTQDRDIGAFFASPVGDGDRIAVIPPLKHMALRTKVVVPREQVHLLDAGGRQVFVPLIGFNALYRWNSGEGQTSIGYLLGRDTKGAKMAPFRMDLGPRVFRGLGARPMPSSVRS
jgi:hypothetical protein